MALTEVIMLNPIRYQILRNRVLMVLASNGCKSLSGAEILRQVKQLIGIEYGVSDMRVYKILKELWSEGVIEKTPWSSRGNNYKWVLSECLQNEEEAYKLGLGV